MYVKLNIFDYMYLKDLHQDHFPGKIVAILGITLNKFTFPISISK